jgi:hypothetical protein
MLQLDVTLLWPVVEKVAVVGVQKETPVDVVPPRKNKIKK